jgi:predicted alpha/beta-fold hydrolase
MSTMQTNTVFGSVSQSDFAPPWWARNRHVQTIYGRSFGQHPEINFSHERLTTPDDDFVDLAWAPAPEQSQPRGIVVLFHGLEGSQDSHYIKQAMATLSRDYLCVLMHFRGCSGEANRTTRAYHSGETSDPRWLISILQQRYPHLPLFALGFSLGGNMLCKLNAEYAQDNPLTASAVVSAPLRLDACSQAINQGFARVYQRRLLRSMQNNLLHKMQFLDYSQVLSVTAADVKQLDSFWAFDDYVTGPLHGFADAQDYYTQCSGLPMLNAISRPTLLLHAQDDPFMDGQVIPGHADLSPSVAYELCQYGGHVGFFTGTPWAVRCDWIAQRVASFFADMLSSQAR